MLTPSDVLTVADVAALLRVGRTTVYRLINEEGLPAFHPGRKTLILREDLLRWAAAQAKSAAAGDRPQTEHDRQMLAGEAQRLGSLAEVQS